MNETTALRIQHVQSCLATLQSDLTAAFADLRLNADLTARLNAVVAMRLEEIRTDLTALGTE